MNQSMRTGWITAQAIVMIALGLGLFYTHATMTTGLYAFFGAILAMLLIAASLTFIAISDFISIAGTGAHGSRIMRRFLFVSAFAAVAGVILIVFVIDIRGTCWLVAAYSLMLSVVKLDLAVRWHESMLVRRILYTLAGVAVIFTALLVWAALSAQDERTQVFVLGAYSLYMGIQMLLTVYYLRHGVLTPPEKQQLV